MLKNNNTNKNNINNSDNNSSLALDLESLNSQYRNLLVRYKQAVLDYVDSIKANASKPCFKYNQSDKGIDQNCYEEIWKKAGCTTTGFVDANSAFAKGKTLRELIYDTFLWATMTDSTHRKGCYGITESSYHIVGIGTDGKLYKKNTLDSIWEKAPGDLNDYINISTGTDGNMLIWCNKEKNVLYKTSLNSSENIVTQNGCCVLDVAMGPDGTLIGVGTDNKLLTKSDLNGIWLPASSSGEYVKRVCIAPDGSIFSIGKNDTIYKKNSYKDLPSQTWKSVSTRQVKSITIAPDDTFILVGTDNKLYTKNSYKDFSTAYNGPYSSSCCMIGVTTIKNPNYDTYVFNKSKEPNYAINATNYIQIAGQAFWGEASISESVGKTLEECKASCSTMENCSGATFKSSNNTCYLRSGPGSAIPSDTKDYAIVPESAQLLKVVDSINSELTILNKKIQDKIVEVYGYVDKKWYKYRDNNDSLISQYNVLQDDREKIDNIVNKYQTLEERQENANLYSTKNYYMFFILFALIFICIIILVSFSIDNNTAENITSFFIKPAIEGTQYVISSIDPYLLMFVIIVIVSVSYLYNKYYLAVYNNMPSFKNVAFYSLIGIFILFVLYNYFSKNRGIPYINIPFMNR